MTSILVPLADGFEEIEAACIIDVLRRAELRVVAVSINSSLAVRGAHGLVFMADEALGNLKADSFDGVVLPGGLPGATNLLADSALKAVILHLHQQKKCIAAICAAPQVLAAHGVLDTSHATCYPGVEPLMKNANMLPQGVVVDGHIITGRGIGSALDFALAIASYFKGQECAKTLRKAMVM